MSIHSRAPRFPVRGAGGLRPKNLEQRPPYHFDAILSPMPNDRENVDAGAAAAARAAGEERPPLGGWSRLYAIVLGELALLILLFTLFARAFS